MLPSGVLNRNKPSHITHTAAVIWAPASINYSGSLFTAYCKIGMTLLPIVLSWCATIYISSSNILLQSGSRPSHCRKRLIYSSSLVLVSSDLVLSLLEVAGWSGFGAPCCIGLVGVSGVVQASFLVGAGRVIPGALCVGASRFVPASFSAAVLVPSTDPSSARSIKCPSKLLPTLFFFFPLVNGVGSGSILLVLGDKDGSHIPLLASGIPWSAGGIPLSAGSVPLLAESIPFSAGSTDGDMVQSRLVLLQSSVAGW